MSIVQFIRTELASKVDPVYREGCRRFFKETVEPWGVRSADLKAIEAAALKQIKPLSPDCRYELFEKLWQSGKLEEGAMVCHLSRKFHREFGRAELIRFERWIDNYVHNWSHCDGVASWLVAGCLENQPDLRGRLNGWTRSKNRWKRRASIVSFLQEAKKGRSIDFVFDTSLALKDDPDLMVQKGVGWVLKEIYPRRPEETEEFLRTYTFSRLVGRIAVEKMK